MTLRYLVALGLLAALSIGAFLILRDNISAQETDATVVNTSGRQRMLSQRTALLAHELVHGSASASDEVDRAALREELLDTIGLMEKSHDGLINGDRGMGLPGNPSAEVRAIYFEPPTLLDSQVLNYLAEAKALANAPDAELTSDNPHLEYIEANVSAVLGALDAMVQQYQEESDSEVATVQRLELLVLGATLAVILMTAVFVFRPMVRRVQQGMGQLKALNETLEQRVQDRTRKLSDVNEELERDITQRRRAEEELRESDERYRTLVESTFEGIAITRAGKILEANESFARMFGYELPEVIGLSPVEMTTPESAELISNNIQSGFEEPYEITGLRKDGATISIEVVGKNCVYEGREARITAFRDISVRKRAEAALRESEQRLRILFEYAPDGYYLMDLQGTFLDGNKASEEITGYKREELIGKKFQETSLLSPDELPKAAAALAKNIGGQPVAPLDLTMNRKDGTRVPVEISTFPVEIDGQPVILGIARDISERKRAEVELQRLNQELGDEHRQVEALNRSLEKKVRQRTRKLQESEKRIRAIVDTAVDGIITINERGIVESFNPAAEQMFGYAAEEMIGQNVKMLMPPPYHEEHDGYIANYLSTGESRIIGSGREVVGRCKDGTTFQLDLAVSEVRLGDRRMFTGIVRDISARKRAEEALQRANEELNERHRQLLDARAEASTDGLTGLSNHRAFQERVRGKVSQAQANGGSLSLIMIDIDDFKGVNDSLGHQAGDEILRLLAQVLADVVPWKDAYRYGGDEFSLVLPGTDRRKAAKVAERLRRAVAKRTDDNGTRVTISLGVASLANMADSAEELIYGADAAMYWAKSAGKNRVGDWGKLLEHRAEGTLPWYAADRGVRAPDVVAALVAALAAKDPATSAHTERCSWYTARLAEEMGLGEEATSTVRLASLLHDVGKLAVPDEVLFKPGPLSEEEWAQMKQHPTAALHVLGQIRAISDAAPAILHHHEHFDGSGYPDGLAGEDIPVASRILLVTDAFDAMTTDRPYRKAMPIEAAVDELKCNSGTQFDPLIVEAFLRILARQGAQPLRGAARAAAERVGTSARRRQNGAKTSAR